MARIVVALGGNALQEKGETSAESQMIVAEKTAKQLVGLFKDGHDVVIVHGNGPQIGTILQKEANFASDDNPAMPLDTCVAMSQGSIGYWLQLALNNVLKENKINRSALTIVTEVLIDKKDPAFKDPTKPVELFYKSSEEALQALKGEGIVVKEDAGRGWRRVVPSPKPLDIIEKKQINQLLEFGNIIITGGGGGVPVCKDNSGRLTGVEAVVDKDFVAAKVAENINADILLILTAVSQVMINFGKPSAMPLPRATIKELKHYINEGQFAPGSMLPKVEASIEFVTSGVNRKTIITTPYEARDAINGLSGTQIGGDH